MERRLLFFFSLYAARPFHEQAIQTGIKQHRFNGVAFLGEFLIGGGDFFLGEVVDRKAGDDFVGAGRGGANGHAGPDVGVEAVFSPLDLTATEWTLPGVMRS